MARRPATRLQLSGQRLLARRMMHALVRRDVAMYDDPLRAQSLSLVVGGVLAALVVAAGSVVGLLRPHGVPDSAPIALASETGALYVRVGDTWHPVPNLTSARLIARTAADPVAVSTASIAGAPRGPSMGIPGAPAAIGQPLPGQAWTVCDGEDTVVGYGGSEQESPDSGRPVLVTPRGESVATTYLLYDGQRAAVDLRNVAVVRALRLDGVDPVPVSRTLLDLVPEVPAIAAPPIAGAGSPGPPGLDGATIGSVVAVQRAGVTERYVVLRDGLQVIGEVAADLIGFAYDVRAQAVPVVAPADIASLPISHSLPVAGFPQRARTPVGLSDGQTVCARWRPGASAGRTSSSNTVVLAGESPYRSRADLAPLAQADGEGPNVDAVAIPGGASAYVRSSRIVGDDGATGARFLVTDAGVIFGIRDDDVATFIGLQQNPDPAPWAILAHLPRGPELSVDAASVVRDGLPTPS